MRTFFCLALLTTVAVVWIHGEACHGDVDECLHEHCSGNGYNMICHTGICTCEVTGGPCDLATDPNCTDHGHHSICQTNADCHTHCPNHGHGHGNHGALHVECMNGKCHCRH